MPGKTEGIVYLNGALVERSRAVVPVSDHAFLYGYGLFETMRAYHGRIFLLEKHLERLMKGAAATSIGPLSAEELGQACNDVLKANHLESARVRLTVTHGASDSLPWQRNEAAPTIVITARQYAPFAPEVYRKGFRAFLSSYRRNSRSGLAGVKSVGYLLNVMARKEAEATGFDEALLLNERGAVAEGTISNVFFVTAESRLVTPSLKSGILAGVTRDVVIELARQAGTRVSQRLVKPAELAQFSEAFLTNSVMEIMPLVEVKMKERLVTVGTGNSGPLTRQLQSAYTKLVAEETA